MIIVLDIYGVAYENGVVNTNLLTALQPYRARGYGLVFASNMAAGQKPLFWDGMGLKAFGDRLFCSGDLNVAKPQPAFYDAVTRALAVPSQSILFIDDSPANIAAARQYGWQADVYRSVSDTLAFIENSHHDYA